VQYMPIDKEAIPYRFEVDLSDEIFTFEVHYNARFDYFTVDIEKGGEVILYGAKLVYGNPLFNFLSDPRLPKVTITPMDEAKAEKRAGYNQLGETVYLVVEDVAAA
jgi:hypothetical protein